VGLNELPCQGQPQTERRFASDSCFGHPVKTIEYARQILSIDPRPVVADLDDRLLLVAIRRQGNPSFAVGIGNGVLKHMLDGLAQAPGIAENVARRTADFDLQLLSFLASTWLRCFRRRAAQATNVHPFLLKGDSPCVASGKIEDVVDKFRQTVDGLENGADIITPAFTEVAGIATAEQLSRLGYDRVHYLAGGYAAWNQRASTR